MSLDWAKTNVELTGRKRGILEILKMRHLMTIDQLEYFHPDFGHQSQSQLLLRRDINKLHEVYFLDKATKKPITQWDGSTKRTIVVALGEVGSEYVGWPKHHKRITYHQGKTMLPKTAHHILRIHDMEIQTREKMKEMDVEVKAWAYECGNRIISHSNRLNPDVFCMLYDRTNNNHYTIFVEYDTGTMDKGRRRKFPELSQKLDRYQEIKNWDGWYEKAISQASRNSFPHLFFVTEEPQRFPGVPELLEEKELEYTVCMQPDYVERLTEFIQKMRK